jgi:non-ribosomal peptide synthetase component F
MRRAADVPLEYNAVELIEHNLAARAYKTALLSAERSLTFSEISAEVNRVGNALAGLGFRQGEPVAILCLDCAEWVTSFFGIVKAGGIAVGMSTLLTSREYDYMLRDCRARARRRSLLPVIEESGRPAVPGTWSSWSAGGTPTTRMPVDRGESPGSRCADASGGLMLN